MSVLLYIVLYTSINTSLEKYRHAAMERYWTAGKSNCSFRYNVTLKDEKWILMGEQTKSIWQFYNLLKSPCKFSDEEFQDEDVKRIFDRILNVMIGLFFHAIRPCYEAKKRNKSCLFIPRNDPRAFVSLTKLKVKTMLQYHNYNNPNHYYTTTSSTSSPSSSSSSSTTSSSSSSASSSSPSQSFKCTIGIE